MRQLGLFLVLTLVVTAGCQPGDAVRKENQLVIWETFNNAEHKVFLEITKKFNTQRKELGLAAVDFRVERVPFDGFLSKIITAAIARRTPDIARVDIGHLARLAYGKVIAPLDHPENLSLWGKTDPALALKKHLDRLIPVAGSANRVLLRARTPDQNDTNFLYGISDQVTNIALYYNKDLFARAGLDPERPPRTWEEFLSFGKKLTNPGEGRYGFGSNISLWWVLPYLYSRRTDVLNEGYTKCLLREESAVNAITFLQDLRRKHKVEGGAWKSGAINPDQGFVNGRYAMIFSGPWNLKSFQGVNFGVGLLPRFAVAGPRRSGQPLTNIGGTSMVILRNTPPARKKIALDFLRFLTSYEAQKFWSSKLGQISVHRQVNQELARELAGSPKRVFLEQVKYARPRPQIPNYDRLESTVNPHIYAIMDGKTTVKSALAKACRKVEEELLANLNR